MNNTIGMDERATLLVGVFRQVTVGLAIAIACFGNSRAQSNEGWSFVGQVGAAKAVTLDRKSKASVEERVWTALRSVCTRSHCIAHFYWEHEYSLQKRLPERELSKHAILVYSTNYGFQWNCAFRPFADNCFKK
jgi:hypothetical protein